MHVERNRLRVKCKARVGQEELSQAEQFSVENQSQRDHCPHGDQEGGPGLAV